MHLSRILRAVAQGNDLVFSMEGGISIAEDPNFRFTFKPNGAATFRAEGEDNTGKAFSGAWEAARPRVKGGRFAADRVRSSLRVPQRRGARLARLGRRGAAPPRWRRAPEPRGLWEVLGVQATGAPRPKSPCFSPRQGPFDSHLMRPFAQFARSIHASARSSSGGVDWSSSRQTLGDDPHENRQSGSTGAPQRPPKFKLVADAVPRNRSAGAAAPFCSTPFLQRRAPQLLWLGCASFQWVTRKRGVRLFDRVTAITAKCCKRC
jgi:hypothetical protein